MKNIFKSYMKTFIKAWIETLGSILFLVIFVMLIFGMLSTPLQISLKSVGIKNQTKLWSLQYQNGGELNNNFLYQHVLENKSIKFKYSNKEYKLDNLSGSWFSEKLINIIENYAKESVKTHFPNEQEQRKQELIKEEKINAVKNIIYIYNKTIDEHDIKDLIIGEQKESFRRSEIFTDEAKNRLSENLNFTNYNFKFYVLSSILKQIKNYENNNFDYQTFINTTFNTRKENQIKDEYWRINISNDIDIDNNEQEFNNLVLSKGRKPEQNNEIVISDLLAKNAKLKINNSIKLGYNWDSQDNSVKDFKIVGIGTKYSTLVPIEFSNIKDSIKDYGQVFVKNSFYTDKQGEFSYQEIFNKSFSKIDPKFNFISSADIYITKNYNNININELLLNAHYNKTYSDAFIFNPNSQLFNTLGDHKEISKLTNLYIITWIYLIIGIILLILGFMFVVFVLKKEINNTRKQLGVFKSMGYKTKELTWVFSVKTFITMLISIGIGYLLSFPFQIDAATKQFNNFVAFDFPIIYSNHVFLILLIIGVPLIFSFISYLIIYRYLNEGALSLLTNGPKKTKVDIFIAILKIIFFPALIYSLINKVIAKSLQKRNKGFSFRMQLAFVANSKGKFALIMGLFLFSSFLFTLQLRVTPVVKNIMEGAQNIYTKNTNHTFNLKKVVPIEFVNRKIDHSPKLENFNIKYKDINESSIENFVNEHAKDDYKTSINFQKLVNKLGKKRDEIIEKYNNKEIELNDLKNQFMNLYSKIMCLSLDKDNWDNIDKDLQLPIPEKNSLFLVTPKDFKGFFINDFAKILTFSPVIVEIAIKTNKEIFKEKYDNTKEFKKYLKDLLNPSNSEDKFKLYEQENQLNKNFINLLLTFINTKDVINPFISVNEILFNGDKEAFTASLPYYYKTDKLNFKPIFKADVKLIDTSETFGGKIRKLINFETITNEQFKSLANKEDNNINAIISYRIAKLLEKNVGDVFEVNMGSNIKIPLRVKAINKVDTMRQNIYVDYKAAMEIINQKEYEIEDLPKMFNEFLSTKQAKEGKINMNDFVKSIKNLEATRDSYSIASSPKDPWMASILVPAKIPNIKIPSSSCYFMNPIELITIPALKAIIDQFLNKMTNAMLMYIIIDVILLTILLIVIMNIIITDSIDIITIMRSLGYTQLQINWMVMGKYISGAIVSFVFAFVMSLIFWKLIQTFIWWKFTVLIAIPKLIWLPFVSIIILGSILYIGWMASMLQIKKHPLTLLVN